MAPRGVAPPVSGCLFALCTRGRALEVGEAARVCPVTGRGSGHAAKTCWAASWRLAFAAWTLAWAASICGFQRASNARTSSMHES